MKVSSIRVMPDDISHLGIEEHDSVDAGLQMLGNSLFCLSPTNPFRLVIFRIISHRMFDQFILALIGISSLFLAMDEPWVEKCACYDASDPSTFSDACTGERTQIGITRYTMESGNSLGYFTFLVYSDVLFTIIFTTKWSSKLLGWGSLT